MTCKTKSYLPEVQAYVDGVLDGSIIAGKEVVAACERWERDKKNPRFELHTKEPDFVINIVQRTMVHKQGEDLDGNPLAGKPFVFSPWQMFITYNLVGWYFVGTNIRRYKEAFIEVPRKSGKTSYAAALAWGLSLLERKSGSSMYIVAASSKQACQSFEFILNSLDANGISDTCRVLNNNLSHIIERRFPDGSFRIEALASNPDAQDSFNCNIAIADEVHAFKKPAQYNRFKEAMKAYTNKLMIGITTAGDNVNSFCYQRQEYAVKVVTDVVQDDSLFVFIARADKDENGDVDYLNPIQHQKANPSYGITIRPQDMMNDALQAQNDPQQRKDFLSRSLDIYTSAMRAYFNLDEFKRSDKKYNWTIDELAKLPINWYGGADLSKLHDLTAACLYGNYNGVDIAITHAWFPIVAAAQKADEDGIPLFGWKDDGWLDMCNAPTVNHADIVSWFVNMRKRGFKIRMVGHDRKFCREYFIGMKKAGFAIKDIPQYFYKKSEGFRHIEAQMKNGNFYYLHSEAFEYCVSNVLAIEKTDDMVQYDKIQPEHRIDIFDCTVFAANALLENMEKSDLARKWFGEG